MWVGVSAVCRFVILCVQLILWNCLFRSQFHDIFAQDFILYDASLSFSQSVYLYSEPFLYDKCVQNWSHPIYRMKSEKFTNT